MKSVLIVSHGSHSPKTKEEIINLVSTLRKKVALPVFEYAFLEIESPSIPEGIERCVKQGASEIIILLNFLNSGKHVDVDIPAIVATVQKKHPAVKIRITKPIGQHPGIDDLFIDLIKHE